MRDRTWAHTIMPDEAIPNHCGAVVRSEASASYGESAVLTAERHPVSLPLSHHWGDTMATTESKPSIPGSLSESVEPGVIGDSGSGYNVYSNTGLSDPIGYTTVIATVGLSNSTWTSTTITAPGTWRFGIRAMNGYGEEQNLDCAVTIVLDAFGNDITNQPQPPTGLRAHATAGGCVPHRMVVSADRWGHDSDWI